MVSKYPIIFKVCLYIPVGGFGISESSTVWRIRMNAFWILVFVCASSTDKKLEMRLIFKHIVDAKPPEGVKLCIERCRRFILKWQLTSWRLECQETDSNLKTIESQIAICQVLFFSGIFLPDIFRRTFPRLGFFSHDCRSFGSWFLSLRECIELALIGEED